ATGIAADQIGIGGAAQVPAGARLRLGRARTGLRSYLAVRGGIDVTPVLGSRASDTLGALGPAPIRRGDLLRVATPDGARPTTVRPSRGGFRGVIDPSGAAGPAGGGGSDGKDRDDATL